MNINLDIYISEKQISERISNSVKRELTSEIKKDVLEELKKTVDKTVSQIIKDYDYEIRKSMSEAIKIFINEAVNHQMRRCFLWSDGKAHDFDPLFKEKADKFLMDLMHGELEQKLIEITAQNLAEKFRLNPKRVDRLIAAANKEEE